MGSALAAGVATLVPRAAPAQPETAEERLESARAEIREAIVKMEEFDLPAAAEPAFIFKP